MGLPGHPMQEQQSKEGKRMDFVSVMTNLGPLSGTVIVVFLFLRNMKEERVHREMIAQECHKVQRESIDMMSNASAAIDRNAKVSERVEHLLIRMNGGH